jgi:hypothetical protein
VLCHKHTHTRGNGEVIAGRTAPLVCVGTLLLMTVPGPSSEHDKNVYYFDFCG